MPRGWVGVEGERVVSKSASRGGGGGIEAPAEIFGYVDGVFGHRRIEILCRRGLVLGRTSFR